MPALTASQLGLSPCLVRAVWAKIIRLLRVLSWGSSSEPNQLADFSPNTGVSVVDQSLIRGILGTFHTRTWQPSMISASESEACPLDQCFPVFFKPLHTLKMFLCLIGITILGCSGTETTPPWGLRLPGGVRSQHVATLQSPHSWICPDPIY